MSKELLSVPDAPEQLIISETTGEGVTGLRQSTTQSKIRQTLRDYTPAIVAAGIIAGGAILLKDCMFDDSAQDEFQKEQMEINTRGPSGSFF